MLRTESALLERDAFWQLVKASPAKQRAVMALRFYDDLTESQVADALGVTVGTVKRHGSGCGVVVVLL